MTKRLMVTCDQMKNDEDSDSEGNVMVIMMKCTVGRETVRLKSAVNVRVMMIKT